MEKKILIRDNVKYNELHRYKKLFQTTTLKEIPFKLYLDKISFPALLSYECTGQRMKYDRKNKFKISFDGIAKKIKEKEVIQKLFDLNPSKPILLMEILYAKANQELIQQDNGDLEYHFTFLQY